MFNYMSDYNSICKLSMKCINTLTVLFRHNNMMRKQAIKREMNCLKTKSGFVNNRFGMLFWCQLCKFIRSIPEFHSAYSCHKKSYTVHNKNKRAKTARLEKNNIWTGDQHPVKFIQNGNKFLLKEVLHYPRLYIPKTLPSFIWQSKYITNNPI